MPHPTTNSPSLDADSQGHQSPFKTLIPPNLHHHHHPLTRPLVSHSSRSTACPGWRPLSRGWKTNNDLLWEDSWSRDCLLSAYSSGNVTSSTWRCTLNIIYMQVHRHARTPRCTDNNTLRAYRHEHKDAHTHVPRHIQLFHACEHRPSQVFFFSSLAFISQLPRWMLSSVCSNHLHNPPTPQHSLPTQPSRSTNPLKKRHFFASISWKTVPGKTRNQPYFADRNQGFGQRERTRRPTSQARCVYVWRNKQVTWSLTDKQNKMSVSIFIIASANCLVVYTWRLNSHIHRFGLNDLNQEKQCRKS